MRLRIETPVESSAETVWAGFSEELFAALAPPFPRLNVQRFDGSERGDVVEAELNFLVFRQRWKSLIVDSGSDDRGYWFIDEGEVLPFFLKAWRHEHWILRREDESSVIVDDIDFETPNRILDYLLFPSMWAQFAYRKPIYRRFFRKPSA